MIACSGRALLLVDLCNEAKIGSVNKCKTNTEAEGVNGIEFASYMLASDMTGLLIFHIGVDSLLYGAVSTVSLVPDP